MSNFDDFKQGETVKFEGPANRWAETGEIKIIDKEKGEAIIIITIIGRKTPIGVPLSKISKLE